MTRILVVDHEAPYRHMLQANLTAEGYQVMEAANAEQVLEALTTFSPDLIILDLAIPKVNGVALCQRIRQFSNLPIILLAARKAEDDIATGLNMGADDFVTKPCSMLELLARIRAVLRRSQTSSLAGVSVNTRYFVHANLKIDLARAEVWRDGHPVMLSSTEYRLLIRFAQNAGRILSGEDILLSIWGPGYKHDREILWVTIARLRQKLESNPRSPVHIITKQGLGYMMPLSDIPRPAREPSGEASSTPFQTQPA